jgi:uncharacterized protein YcnI
MKRTVIALLGGALLAGWVAPAWAHVTAEDPSVPKDSETEITFSVPVEAGGHTQAKSVHAMHEGHDEGGGNAGQPSAVYNTEVTISVPRGFEVVDCDKSADWDCKAAPAKEDPHAGMAPGGTVTFTRVTKQGTTMDHLPFTVHTPAGKGTFSFPTTQKMSDGTEKDWNSDGVTGKNPAPRIQVTDEAADEGHDADHK